VPELQNKSKTIKMWITFLGWKKEAATENKNVFF